jgi:hypothetical protein
MGRTSDEQAYGSSSISYFTGNYVTHGEDGACEIEIGSWRVESS